MFYGDEKRREMARSILPSTRRKSARDELREVKQRNRHQIRQALRKVLRHEEYEADDDVDLNYYPYEKISYIVSERRAADKLGHFEKWAIEITKDIEDPSTRLSYMRSILPQGLIGEHALSHLRSYEEFRTNKLWYGFRLEPPLSPEEKAAQKKAEQERRHARRVRLLWEIVETGWGHRLLTRAMSHKTVTWPVWQEQVPTQKYDGGQHKYVTVYEDRYVDTPMGPTEPRKLTGLGDIEDFLRDIYRASSVSGYVKADVPRIERQVRPNRYYYGKRDHLKRHTYNVETIVTTRPNPERHGEWFESVSRFLDVWEESKGDPAKVNRYVQKGRF